MLRVINLAQDTVPVHSEVARTRSPIVTNLVEQQLVRWWFLLSTLRLALMKYRSLGDVRRALLGLRAKYRKAYQEPVYHKVAKVGGRYFWRLSVPGFPSAAMSTAQEAELNRVLPFTSRFGLRQLLIGITRKCPLACAHCYEWNRLHGPEVLSREDLRKIVSTYQEYGTSQIIFGGGEPMLRLRDICDVVQGAAPCTDFWMYTSGFHLGATQAQALADAGLTGVMVSLDHHQPEDHDRFRGFPGAFQNASHALSACNQAGLVTGISFCATQAYCTERNLYAFMRMARDMGVSLVQFFQVRAGGRATEDMVLTIEQEKLLEKLAFRFNTNRTFADFPIVNVPDAVRRNVGCFFGSSIVYINTLGQVQACPLCEQEICDAVHTSASEVIRRVIRQPCPNYEKVDEYAQFQASGVHERT